MDNGFFSPPLHQPFFAPQASVQRKCEECEAEEKKTSKERSCRCCCVTVNLACHPRYRRATFVTINSAIFFRQDGV